MSGRRVKAPRQDAEHACDSISEKRRSGIELIFDCGGCREASSLGNPRCFGSVLAAMRHGGAPAAISFRSHMERRYGLVACSTMGRISEVLGKVSDLQSQLARNSGKGEMCKACVFPLSKVLGDISTRISASDVGGAISLAAGLGSLEQGSSRTMCLDCAGITKVQVEDISRNLRDIERLVLQGAFDAREAE